MMVTRKVNNSSVRKMSRRVSALERGNDSLKFWKGELEKFPKKSKDEATKKEITLNEEMFLLVKRKIERTEVMIQGTEKNLKFVK